MRALADKAPPCPPSQVVACVSGGVVDMGEDEDDLETIVDDVEYVEREEDSFSQESAATYGTSRPESPIFDEILSNPTSWALSSLP